MANIIPILILLSFSVWAIFSLYIFASRNGTFDHFGAVLDRGILPDGTPLVPVTTGGTYPTIDWQIKAPAAFLWSFEGNGLHPDASLAGFLFAGAWAPSWILIVLESFRRGNRRRLISFISIWGVFQFQNAHAFVTPLYLAVHLFTSPMATIAKVDDVLIDPVNLLVLPASFIMGFVIPSILCALPAPSVVSIRFKQTAFGIYQQWNLFIALPHFILAMILRWAAPSSCIVERKSLPKLYRRVYAFAFALAAMSYLPVMIITCTAAIWPALFSEDCVHLLQPSHVLVPTSPFSGLKAKDLAQGMFWLAQWDYFGGNFAQLIWAVVLYRKARTTIGLETLWVDTIKRALFYLLIGGPIGIAVGMIWERDELLLGLESKMGEEEPLLPSS
ncbi:MAG: hypothetical protein M1818_007463 [Claussenomyces sp. TS43310]|nr:MAG: hypothetical protein M1818_007463 [Claussenomyces sp. TS43310]